MGSAETRMIDVDLAEESVSVLEDYALVPIAFEVRSVFDVEPIDGGLHGFRFTERTVDPPWLKDYDSAAGEGPLQWSYRWDISNWRVIAARHSGRRVAGCVIAFDTQGVDMLEGRNDIAVLWDLRVASDFRGEGIGGRLIDAAAEWARSHHCRLLKVETQNINVPACRLYARYGFVLGAVKRHAYPDLSTEVQLIWYREL